MKSWKRVTIYIPAGKENAITRSRLSDLTGLSDRINRSAIEAARKAGVKIISQANGKGYYIAENDDDWLLFLEEHRKRAISELNIYNEGIRFLSQEYVVSQIVPVRAHLRRIKGDMPLCEGQISLDIEETEGE